MEPQEHTKQPLDSRKRALARNLRGVLLPFPTPFDKNDNVDARALASNIARWNETGITGYVALGSTGERVHLDEEERAAVIKVGRASTPEHMAFIVGVGQQSTRGTINEAKRAAELGADALLAITPSFYRSATTADALLKHFTALADVSQVPVILYSIPQNTAVSIAPELAARLAQHENVIGIKDSSGDVLNLAETIRLATAAEIDFAVMTGHGGAVYPSLAAGAHGAILAAGCAVPELCVALLNAVRSGNHDRGLALQRLLTPIARAVTTQYGIGGLKAALDHVGYHGGSVRAPLELPNEAARNEIARLMDAVIE